MKALFLAGALHVGICMLFGAEAAAQTPPTRILFVGNSYTFGRVDPVMSYNAANVHDLTAAFWALNATGTNAWEPHPWGGVPGIFKAMTEEAGLHYEVYSSTRNAASLRQHFLNAINKDWDLRGNVASQRWDVVVLQELSDGALPAGRSRNANLPAYRTYAAAFEQFIHQGHASTVDGHEIPANPNASPATRIYLTETWARPDMVFAHLNTRADPGTPDGAPVVDTRKPGTAALYYPSLAAMTADLHAGIFDTAAANPGFAGVIPAGDAFQRAVDQKLVQAGGFYDASGACAEAPAGGPVGLWWKDRLHASKYGSYLDALVQFATLTGRDPRSLGADERSARDLGIDSATAQMLEEIAAKTTKH